MVSLRNDGTGWRDHLAFAAVAATLCSLESWIFGPLSWIYGYGAGLETIPAYLALAANDRNFSFLSPFVAGGIDRLAFWGNADPISIELLLFSTLPVWLANGLHRFLQYLVAIFFAARVGEEQLGLDRRSSAFLGLLHGCFAYQTTGALFTIAGVPLLLWVLDRLTTRGRGWLVPIAAGAAFSLLTTFTFSDPYLLVFAAMWLLLVQRRYSWHAAGHFFRFSLALLVADSPQLFAIAANGWFSHRAGWPSEQINWSIDGLFYRQLQFDVFAQSKFLAKITLNVPALGFLCGVPLAFHAMRRNGAARQHGALFLRIFAVWAILSQKWLWILVQLAVATLLPFVMGVYMGRFFQIPGAFVIACGLTMVCRLACEALPYRRLRPVTTSAAIGFAALMIIWPKVHLFYPIGVEGWGQRNYEIAALDDLRRRETNPFRVASVLPLQPAYAYAQGLETADGWANLFPAVYRDLWWRGMAPLFSELPYTRKIFGVDTPRPEDNFIFLGADLIEPVVGALPGEDPRAALQSGFDIERRFNLHVLRLLNIKYLLSEYPLKGDGIELEHAPRIWPDFPQSRSRNTGLTHGAKPPPQRNPGWFGPYTQPISDLWSAWQRNLKGKDIFIYRLKGTLPRFRFVDTVSIEHDGNAVLDRLAAGGDNEAVIELADASSLAGNRHFMKGTVSIVRYTPDEIVLDVEHRGLAFLVVAQTWSPYWRAEQDEKPAQLIRTNHAQLGLMVGDNVRRVRIRYAPPYSWDHLLRHAKTR